jgi:hypothetical protein
MIAAPIQLLAAGFAALSPGGPPVGKAAFIGVFVLVLVWLLLMPSRLIGHADGAPPPWRNTRLWAIAITVVEISVYAYFG